VLQYDWENSVGYWVVNTAHAVRRSLNTELSREGITLRQWEVLACLALSEEMSQAEVAERLGIEAPTLVGILDRMERDGWLERLNCAHDRRKKRIRCTKKAEQLWARMVACAHRVRARAINGLTSAEIETLRSICSRILVNLDTPYDGPMVTPDASLADTVCDMVPESVLQAARAQQALLNAPKS
jgi:MarR family transcriptional regulator for hemolysin